MTKIRNLVLLLVIVPSPSVSQVAVDLVSRDEMTTPAASIVALERSHAALLEARAAIDEALLEVDETLALLRALESRRNVEKGLVHAVRSSDEPPRAASGSAVAGAIAIVEGILDALDLGRTARDLFVGVERRLAAGVEGVRPVVDRIRSVALRKWKEKDAALAVTPAQDTPTLIAPPRSPEVISRGVARPPSGLQAFEAREVSGSEPKLSSAAAPPPLSAPSLRSETAHDEAIVRYALPDGLLDPQEASAPLEPTLPAVERHLETIAPPEE
jgi:hypothetical protein